MRTRAYPCTEQRRTEQGRAEHERTWTWNLRAATSNATFECNTRAHSVTEPSNFEQRLQPCRTPQKATRTPEQRLRAPQVAPSRPEQHFERNRRQQRFRAPQAISSDSMVFSNATGGSEQARGAMSSATGGSEQAQAAISSATGGSELARAAISSATGGSEQA